MNTTRPEEAGRRGVGGPIARLRPLQELAAVPAERVGRIVLCAAFAALDQTCTPLEARIPRKHNRAGRPHGAAHAHPLSAAPLTSSMRCITCAGFAAATRASSRTASTAFGSGTRTRTTTIGSGDPGRSPPGSTDQPVAAVLDDLDRAARLDLHLPASPAAVPRSRYSSTARATIARRRSSSQLSSSAIPTQPASQSRKSSGVSARVEVRVEVVERAPDRREHLVERAEEALREVVVLVDRGQRRTHRVRPTPARRTRPAHQAPSTRTWCS